MCNIHCMLTTKTLFFLIHTKKTLREQTLKTTPKFIKKRGEIVTYMPVIELNNTCTTIQKTRI